MRLRELRTERLLTQKELCAKSGVAYTTVQHLESNPDFDPRWSSITTLASFFRVSVDYLMGKERFNFNELDWTEEEFRVARDYIRKRREMNNNNQP